MLPIWEEVDIMLGFDYGGHVEHILNIRASICNTGEVSSGITCQTVCNVTERYAEEGGHPGEMNPDAQAPELLKQIKALVNYITFNKRTRLEFI